MCPSLCHFEKERQGGRAFGDFFMVAMSLSREQRSWMVTQSWIGGHIHCRQKHRKCGGLRRECEQRAHWHLYHLNKCQRQCVLYNSFAPVPHIGDLAKKYPQADRRSLKVTSTALKSQMQLPANGDVADAKRPKDRRTDAEFSVSAWLALLLCLGLAFSYIILQRKEAPITGKANTDLWGIHTSLCTCSGCMWPIRMPGTFLFGFRFHHSAQHAVSGLFV